MPIKFRCNYCRQFLGISRAQAGGIVDCPTCGRSIRVPQLDGTQQPLPAPELNLQDTHLARALEELARLGAAEPQEFVSSNGPGEEPDEIENEIPQPIPEPIPIEVPIPPTPVAIQPALPPDASNETASGNSASAAAFPLDVLTELATHTPPSQPERVPSAGDEPVRTVRSPVRRSPLVSSALLILVFLGGMLFERFVRVLESNRPAELVPDPDKPADPVAPSVVSGRITYKSSDGTSQADRGARILAFPSERSGEAKLSIVGFRPADSAADARVAGAGLQALGGGLATANDSGQYELSVPAGSYHLLILSHFQSRETDSPPAPELLKLLSVYFDKPEDLLGRVQFEFSPLRVRGTGDVRDHSF